MIAERDQNVPDEFEDSRSADGWIGNNTANFRYSRTPPEGKFPSQNSGMVKFEAPKVPVVFVLGTYSVFYYGSTIYH